MSSHAALSVLSGTACVCFHDVGNVEALAKELIEPCLSGQAGLHAWNTEALAWG